MQNSNIITSPKKTGELRDDIQGFRAFAVVAVILFHVNRDWAPGGFVGVDIFLVISGYLISSIIIFKKEKGGFSFGRFYLSRASRILPAYLFLLFAVTFIVAILFTQNDFRFFQESLWPSLLFNSNNYFANFGDYFAPNSNELPLLHTWSLAVEMQFYLLLPLFLIFIKRQLLKPAIWVILVSFTTYVTYQIYYQNDAQNMYFSLLARIPEFLFGTLVAASTIGNTWSATKKNVVAILGLVMMIGSVFFIDKSTPFPGVVSFIPVIGIGLVIAAKSSFINKLFSIPVLVWIGGLSYSLYLWHWPVLAIIRYYYGVYELNFVQLFMFSILTILFSYFSFRIIENRFRKRVSTVTNLVQLSALVLITVVVIKIGDDINLKLVPPLNDLYTQYANKQDICHGKVQESCMRGSIDSSESFLVIGDSHAAQLNYFFNIIGNKNEQSYEILTASSCVTIPDFDTSMLPEWSRESCLS
jgi:peptidoglycan/LPS O-acetylase OafA/YrhL